jgi:hypothetical protein
MMIKFLWVCFLLSVLFSCQFSSFIMHYEAASFEQLHSNIACGLQVVFLQQQLDEKERTIQLLQLQMTKYTNSDATSNAAAKESCNAATQTERVCF